MKSKPWIFRGASLRPFNRASILVLCMLGSASVLTPLRTYAQAQVLTQAPFTLRQAVESALARLPETRSAPQRREAVESQSRAARSWTPEPVAFETSLRTDRALSNNGDREYVAGVSIPIWLPGQRNGGIALAQAEQVEIDSRIAAASLRAAAAVRDAWWALHLARIDLTVIEERMSNAAQLAADVTRRVRAGDLARADQHQADAALAAAEADAAAARTSELQASQALRALVGPAITTPLATAAEAVPELSGPAGIEAALRQHPAVQELSARADTARRSRDLAGLQRRANPEVSLATTRERGNFEERYGQSITIGVRIPFGSDDRYRAKVATAAADQTEAEVQLAIESERITSEIELAQARVSLARSAAEAAEKRAVLSREAQGFYEKSFRLGETDLPTRLRIGLDTFAAERQSARARVEQAHAISQWRQALGLLPQ